MIQKIDNRLKGCNILGDYVGGNQTKNYYISMFQDFEREFVVTHNVNIKPVSYFTGREKVLQELRQRIEEGRKSVLVSGMGGIGKTQICRKLFEEYSAKNGKGENNAFKHIGYIEYNGDMDSSLMKCLRYKEQDNPKLNKEAAWRELEYLAADGKLLLFVDNVDRPIGADAGLKRLNAIPGAVVLTSRRTSLGKEFGLLKIGFLSTEQCKKIYERIRYEDSGRKVPEEEVTDLEYVINKLAARHTITIEFLAHIAKTKHWGVKRLRNELQDKGFCLEYKDDEEKLVNIQKSYEALYDLSKLTEAEQNILEAFSVFPYIPLAADVCNQWLLSDANVSENDDVLMGLYQKGWLQFDVKQESYSMHPVFAQFIYQKCKPSAEKHHGLIAKCQNSNRLGKLEGGSVLDFKKYIPFAENIIEKIDMGKDIEQADFIFVVAYLMDFIGEFRKAEGLYCKALWLRKKILGEEHPVTAMSYNNLAYVYRRQGEYKKAEELYKKGLGISEKVLGEKHPFTATSYNNLAGVYDRQGEYKKAEELYKKGLGIREKVLGEEHLSTATSYNNLAGVYKKRGEYKIAISYYFKAYNILLHKLGINHPNTQIVYENMEITYSEWNPNGNIEQWLDKQMKE
ncbi:MAG: ATP-binding protein [Lachnospiraceae bacterium]|nr:ATP-binding protein [Lachnospiraceae bacterium]